MIIALWEERIRNQQRGHGNQWDDFIVDFRECKAQMNNDGGRYEQVFLEGK